MPSTIMLPSIFALISVLQVAYGSLPADDMLAWFEMHKSMGVNKVLTYTDNLNPAAQKVLDHYTSIGMAEVHPFVVPKYGKLISMTTLFALSIRADSIRPEETV